MNVLKSMLVVAVCAGGAAAQFTWSDGFEPYLLGSLCGNPGCGNAGASGGWAGWDNADPAAGTVVDSTTSVPPIAAHSGSKFLQIGTPSDAIQPFSLNYPATYPTSGSWEVSAWTYIPTGGLTAATWFIINNIYNHGGPQQWTLQLQATPAGVWTDLNRGGTVPVVFDAWVRIQVLVDLNANLVTVKYNGQTVSSGVWTVLGGISAIANIDLYTGGTIFYDDLSVLPLVPLYETNSPEAALALNGVQASTITPAITTVPTGASVSLTADSFPAGNPYEIAVVLDPVQASLYTTGNQQVVNIQILHPTLTFFNSGTAVPNFVPFPGPIAISFFAPPVAFTASAQLVTLDGSHPDGVRLSQAVQLTTVPCANPQNFDSATNGTTAIPGSPGVYPVCWTDGGGTYMWKVWSGTTPSGSTGPDFDHTTGTGKYMYCETSGPVAGNTFILNAPPNQPTTGTASFWYHMYGATTGPLALQELQGGVWTTVWTLTGNQGNLWIQATATLATNPTTLRFHYTRGSSFTGDAAIDDFQIN